MIWHCYFMGNASVYYNRHIRRDSGFSLRGPILYTVKATILGVQPIQPLCLVISMFLTDTSFVWITPLAVHNGRLHCIAQKRVGVMGGVLLSRLIFIACFVFFPSLCSSLCFSQMLRPDRQRLRLKVSSEFRPTILSSSPPPQIPNNSPRH